MGGALEKQKKAFYNKGMSIPIVSIIVYCSCLALLLVKSRLAPAASFNKDAMTHEATKNLKGLAAIGVICHHLSQPPANGGPMDALGQMQLFREIGFLFVAIFFFVSGYGLFKSLQTKPGYLNGFFRRRVLPIVVCFYIMNLFYIAFHLVLGTKMDASEWVCKATGIALLNDNAWFVPAIIINYLAFFIAFSKIKSGRLSFAFVFLAIALQVGFFLFNKHFPWWLGERGWWKNGGLFSCPWYKKPVALWFEGEWWVNSTIAFFVGMIVARHEEKVFEFFTRAWAIKFAASLLLLSASFELRAFVQSKGIHYWLEFSGDNSTPPRAIMLCVETFQVLAWLLFVYVFRMRLWSQNRALEFWGSHSLEFYLMQALPLRAFSILFGWTDKSFRPREPLELSGYAGQLKALGYLLLVLASTMLLGIAVKFLTKKICGLLDVSKRSAAAKSFFDGEKN